jgi:arsenate reductase (thioredoxin)
MDHSFEGVVFICYGNACRSIMAEALARHHWGESLRVASAGIAPLGRIAKGTLEVLAEVNVSCAGLYSKGFSELAHHADDVIVNLTDMSIQDFLPKSIHGRVIEWYVRDPYGESLNSYRQARDTIEWLVTEKLPEWLQRHPGS